MLVSLRSKLFEFSLIYSFLGCLRQRQKVVRHIRVFTNCLHSMASSTSRGVVHHILPIFQGLQNHWMCTISHTTTCPAIHMHLICQFACIQSTFHSVKGHSRRIKSQSGDGPRQSWDVVDDRPPHQLVHGEAARRWTGTVQLSNLTMISHSPGCAFIKGC